MDLQNTKIESFTDLRVWQHGHMLVLEIYKLTKLFPKEEQFGLTNQIRRAAVSITSNIAEGFSRKSYKEKSQFYSISLGSLTEVQNQLLIAKDINYLTNEQYNNVAAMTVEISKMTNGLIKKTKAVILNS